MTEMTDRLELPLLAAGQAQKEITHNEALARLAALVQPVVQAITSSVPASPVAGQCWLVGTGATGAWAGRDGALAAWTTGGWRFVAPFDGMQVWSLGDAMPVIRVAGNWTLGIVRAASVKVAGLQVVAARQPAIPTPAGGATIDTEARVVIAGILCALRSHGLIEA